MINCAAMQERKAALAIYSAILEYEPGHATAHYRLALHARASGQREQAIRALKRAIVSDPYSSSYHLELAELLRELGDNTNARVHYQKAVACDASVADRFRDSSIPF